MKRVIAFLTCLALTLTLTTLFTNAAIAAETPPAGTTDYLVISYISGSLADANELYIAGPRTETKTAGSLTYESAIITRTVNLATVYTLYFDANRRVYDAGEWLSGIDEIEIAASAANGDIVWIILNPQTNNVEGSISKGSSVNGVTFNGLENPYFKIQAFKVDVNESASPTPTPVSSISAVNTAVPTSTPTPPASSVQHVASTSDAIGTFTVKVGALNIRAGSGSSFANIDKLYKGDKVEVLEVVGSWVKIRWYVSDNDPRGYAFVYRNYGTLQLSK